jgi:hypothetical protein
VEGRRGREGKGEASEGERARADEGGEGNGVSGGRQRQATRRASDDGAARRLSSKINEPHLNTYLFFDVVACAYSHPKKSGSRVTQLKIADASKPHQKLVPVCKRGVPVCVRGVRQENSHRGRRITHNEVVRIRGLTYIY